MKFTVNPFGTLTRRLRSSQLKPESATGKPGHNHQFPFDIALLDEALYRNGRESLVLYRNHKRKAQYRVRLFLDGDDLPQVASATYSFPEATGIADKRVARNMSNPRCQLFIWAWGLFDIDVTLTFKDGHSYGLRHSMTFNRDFERARTEFIEVS